MPTTYDNTTALGQVRLLIADTNTDAATFDDSEITAFLALGGLNVYVAAACALDALASDGAKLAIRIRDQEMDTDPTELAAQLIAQANSLRSRAIVNPTVASPDQFFSNNSDMGVNLGSMSIW